MERKKYQYQGRIIELTYYPSTTYHYGGYHWQCFLETGKKYADSLKQYPYPSVREALEKAKEEIDWLLDLDTEEFPVAVGET